MKRYPPKTLGTLSAADLGRSGHVTIASLRAGIKADVIYLDRLDVIHHGAADPDGTPPITYLSDAHDVTVLAPSTSRWEVERGDAS